MLAVDVGDLGPEVGRRNELVDRRMDEHARGVDAGLVAEHVEADAGLGRLHGDAAHLLEAAGQGSQLFVLEVRDLDPEEVAELKQHLVHRRVAGPLPYAVDARREHLGA